MKIRSEFIAALAWTLIFLAFANQLFRPIIDPDLWWQLAAGREMVMNKVFLRTDIFTHTFYGQEWINFEWLSQVIFFSIYKVWGVGGIYFLKIALSLSAAAILISVARVQRIHGPVLALLGWFGFFLLKSRLNQRVELFSLNFLGVLLLLLMLARNHPGFRRFLPYSLFALTALWCNLHAGFIYGILLTAAINVGARWAKENPAYIQVLDRSFISMLAAFFVNPYGAKLVYFFVDAFLMMTSGKEKIISEFTTTTVAAYPLFWFSFLVSAVFLLRGILKRSTSALFWTPALIVFGVLGCNSQRAVVLLPFALIPFLSDVIREYKLVQRLNAWKGARAALWLLIIAPLVYFRPAFALPQVLINEKFYPVKACQYVKDHHLTGNMFNTYVSGGYIIWALGPERKVFMDGRFSWRINAEQRSFFTGTPAISAENWKKYFEKHHIAYAITNYPAYYSENVFSEFSPLNLMFPRKDWKLVFWDDSALVFVRRAEAGESSSLREYKSLWPYNLRQMELLVNSGQLKKSDVLAELNRQESETGSTDIAAQVHQLLLK